MKNLQLTSLNKLIWLARRTAWYLGWIPLLLSVLLLSIWVYLLQQQPQKTEQLASLEQEIRQLAVQATRPAAAKATVVENTAVAESEPATISALWEQLPTSAELSPRMLEIAALAQKHHIPLNVGDYQWQVHQAAGNTKQDTGLERQKLENIEQFDMRFAVQTDYVTCRRFILEVLRRYPTMALTGLELRKNETAQPTIEATLTFSMFIRGGHAYAS